MIIFQETLLGPKDFKNLKNDFIEKYSAKPDFEKELKFFAKSPFDPKKTLKIKMFIDFLIYKDKEVIIEREGVKIRIV